MLATGFWLEQHWERLKRKTSRGHSEEMQLQLSQVETTGGRVLTRGRRFTRKEKTLEMDGWAVRLNDAPSQLPPLT
jgi:hypothetical protein